ncbi:hypothetical protein Golax_022988, partial [Gossypium laxum]|nr:hypothetical protein [Gossypium laxum]
AELIDQSNRTWKKELITSTFPEDVTEKIICILLAEEPHKDFWVWSAEASGEFTRELSCQAFLQENQLDFVQWLTWVFVKNSASQCRIFCCALWAIWGDRNDRVHKKVSKSGKVIGRFVVKINFDAAYAEKFNQAAMGIVASESEGKVLLSCPEIYQRVVSAFAAEALACRRATQIGIDMNWEKVIIEGDSLSIIKKCKTSIPDKSNVCAYIHYIHKLLLKYKECIFEYISRAGNSLAHTLAKETMNNKIVVYLVGGVLEYVEEQEERDRVREPD